MGEYLEILNPKNKQLIGFLSVYNTYTGIYAVSNSTETASCFMATDDIEYTRDFIRKCARKRGELFASRVITLEPGHHKDLNGKYVRDYNGNRVPEERLLKNRNRGLK